MNRLIWRVCICLGFSLPSTTSAAEDPFTEIGRLNGAFEQVAYTQPDLALRYLDSVYTLAADQEWWHYCYQAQLQRVAVASRHMLLEENLEFLDVLDSLGAAQDTFIRTYYLKHPDLEARLRRGNYAYKTGQFSLALEAFEEIRDKLLPLPSRSTNEVQLLASTLRYIGAIQQSWGGYSLSLEAYGQALKVAGQIAENHPVLARIPHTHKLLGDAYRLNGQLDLAEIEYKKALNGQKKAFREAQNKGPYLNRIRAAENSLVFLLLEQGKTAAAATVLKESKIDAPDGSVYAADVDLAWAKIHQAAGRYDEALTSINRTIAIYEVEYPSTHPDPAHASYLKGRILQAQNRWAEAIELTQQALADLPADVVLLPLQRLRLLSLKQDILTGMVVNGQDPSALQGAQATTEQAVELIDQIRERYESISDKARLVEISQQILHQGLSLYAAAYQHHADPTSLEAGFRLAERSKGLVLLEAWQKARIGSYTNVPDSLLQEGAHLTYKREALAKQLAGENAPEGTARRLEQTISAQKAWKNLIQTQYPEFYHLRYAVEQPDLQQVQRSLLEPDQAMISYVIAGDTLHLFAATTRGVVWKVRTGAREVDTLVHQFRLGMTQLLNQQQSDEALENGYAGLKASGYRLWQMLIQPIAAELELPDRLVISPDGPLNLLPFGSLTRQPAEEWPDDPASAPYLIQEYAFSYIYSASLWAEMKERPKRRKSSGWLGFAPEFSPDQELNPLYYSEGEVRDILAEMDGKGVLGAAATRTHFLEMAPHFQYLHLATHGQAPSGSGPGFLAFAADSLEPETGLLSLEDIYQLDLDAEMVVLSACETGLGEWKEGEGIMSLARGFAYAKAQSIIPSLWTVDGAASAKLMKAFYQALRNGFPKDVAMQMAQKEALELNQFYGSHPFYWAAFLPIGDMAPIRGQGLPFWSWLVLLGGIGGLLWWRKGSQS
ncbi:MAG: CHAT domain-containing tetratricopeptide repeat protein [Bacteroidota bacterium]